MPIFGSMKEKAMFDKVLDESGAKKKPQLNELYQKECNKCKEIKPYKY